MSILDAMAGAANDAAQGALMGRIIGNANDRALAEEERADGWHAYAQRLENQVEQLKLKLAQSDGAKQELALKLKATEEEFAKFKGLSNRVCDSNDELLYANLTYGKEIKKRLRQMEKGLQHSSADTESLTFMLKVYEELFGDFSALASKGTIQANTVSKAQSLSSEFMNGGKLTNDRVIQEIIDLVPMPVKMTGVYF